MYIYIMDASVRLKIMLFPMTIIHEKWKYVIREDYSINDYGYWASLPMNIITGWWPPQEYYQSNNVLHRWRYHLITHLLIYRQVGAQHLVIGRLNLVKWDTRIGCCMITLSCSSSPTGSHRSRILKWVHSIHLSICLEWFLRSADFSSHFVHEVTMAAWCM